MPKSSRLGRKEAIIKTVDVAKWIYSVWDGLNPGQSAGKYDYGVEALSAVFAASGSVLFIK